MIARFTADPTGRRRARAGRYHRHGARRVQACSGGEQQRLRFALALLPDPDLWCSTSRPPAWTSGPAGTSGRPCAPTRRGRTIVFATHYLDEADEFADRTVLVARGRIVADGTTADVRAAYGGRTVTFRPPAEVVHPDGVDPAWLEQGARPPRPPRRHRPRRLQRQPRGGVPRPHRHPPAPDLRRRHHEPEAPDDHHDHARTTTTARAGARAWLAYGRLDLRRQLRDRMGMFFAVALPAFLFVVFGLGDDEAYGSGNVALYVMISMAAYGAVSATTTVAGRRPSSRPPAGAASSALTPIPPLTFVAVKTAVAMVVAAVPIGLVYAIGAATGARGNLLDWVLASAHRVARLGRVRALRAGGLPGLLRPNARASPPG